jgi:transglutaminase-like putative cysteine protease
MIKTSARSAGPAPGTSGPLLAAPTPWQADGLLAGALLLATLPHLAHAPRWPHVFFYLALAWRFLAQGGGYEGGGGQGGGGAPTRGAAQRLDLADLAQRLSWRWLALADLAQRLGGRLGLPTPGAYAQRHPWGLPAAGVIGFLAVVLSQGGKPGLEPGVAILILACGLKLLEAKAARDYYVLCFLGYFVTVTNFLYSQALWTLPYLVTVVLLFTAALVGRHDPTLTLALPGRLRLAGLLLLQGLPIMLSLFYFFPRLPSPQWVAQGTTAAKSGLSDSMSPGEIGQLTLSDEVAFRVSFPGQIPAKGALYWRGPVLWRTDGTTWRRLEPPPPLEHPVEGQGPAIAYEITVEPHQKHWLFSLDLPLAAPATPTASLHQGYEILTRRPVDRRLRYSLRSSPQHRTGPLAAGEREWALALPLRPNPRAKALGKQWQREERGDGRRIAERAIRLFRQEGFSYTLSPPLAARDPVDAFLFASRAGFCEHYAAAFTWLMRAAGVPARVVTGYQGGELNPMGRYLIVRQLDAHAWTEIWLPGEGWTRVDPTAAVRPDRIELGAQGIAAAGIPGLLEGNEALFALWQSSGFFRDAVERAWNDWVIGYGEEAQQDLLWRLGMNEWSTEATLRWGGLAALLAGCLSLPLWRRYRRAPAADPVVRAYQGVVARLAGIGCAPAAGEGPRDFAARVAARRPDLALEVERITRMYLRLRYDPGFVRPPLAEWLRVARAFRPAREPPPPLREPPTS